jgi:GGDEF domain-containing protein
MSLFKSLSTGAGSAVKLMKMNSIPGTEDLRFLLTTAKDAKKCAELPFQNPSNGMTFTIKVIPPALQAGPKWTFERGESPNAVFVWVRESPEVMMIQNKIKIDCASQAVHGAAQESDQMQAQTHDGVIFSQSAQNGSSTFNNMPSQSPGTGVGFDALQNSGPQPKQYSGWMPEQYQVKLPESFDLQEEVANNIYEALTDAKTGLVKFFAFVFFLQREVAHHEKNATKLSVLTFDFKSQVGEPMPLPPEFVLWLSGKVNSLVTSLDVLTRLETGEFALLLSGTGASDGALSAEVLYQQIVEDEGFAKLQTDPRALAIGCASIPETCKDAGVLLAASLKAKDMARTAGKKTLLFPNR